MVLDLTFDFKAPIPAISHALNTVKRNYIQVAHGNVSGYQNK